MEAGASTAAAVVVEERDDFFFFLASFLLALLLADDLLLLLLRVVAATFASGEAFAALLAALFEALLADVGVDGLASAIVAFLLFEFLWPMVGDCLSQVCDVR